MIVNCMQCPDCSKSFPVTIVRWEWNRNHPWNTRSDFDPEAIYPPPPFRMESKTFPCNLLSA